MELNDYITINSIPSGVGVYDLTGSRIETVYLNDGYYQMIGARREDRSEYFGRGAAKAIHPDDYGTIVRAAHECIRDNKRMLEIVCRVLTGTGSYCWLGLRANHIRLENGTERFFAVYFDVDSYVSKQLSLEKISNTMTSILDNIPGGVAVLVYKDNRLRIDYANNAFYEIHCGSQEYWNNKNSDYLQGVISEERQQLIDEFESMKSGEKKRGNMTYRVTGEDGAIHWINSVFNLSYSSGNVYQFYASFVNMDELKAMEQAKGEIRRMYEAAVEDAKLVVWEFDIVNHRVIMAENEFSMYDYRKFNLPKVTENVPASLVGYIDDSSVDAFLDMYSQIEDGKPHASCEVWYKLKPGTEPRCERIMYTTVFDGNGVPIRAYGIGQNITREKLAQEEYDRLRSQFAGNLTNIVSTTHLDISLNRYLGGYSPYQGVEEARRSTDADGHFRLVADTIDNAEIREQVLKKFNCKNLIEMYKRGEQQFEQIYPVRTSRGDIMWVTTTTHLTQNPESGNIEVITYTKDITRQKRINEIVERLSRINCDYIAVIDVAQKTFNVQNNNWDCDYIIEEKSFSFDSVRDILAKNYISDDKSASFLAMSELDVILKALDDKEQYVIAYDYFSRKDNGRPCKKLITLSWLNNDRRELLCMQQDVTETYRKEQEQIFKLEKANTEAVKANEAKSMFLSGMSHDMRTPLNGVLGYTALALKETEYDKIRDYLGKIDTSGKLLRDLINDVLELSKIESGKTVIDYEAAVPEDVIPSVAVSLRPSAELKNIKYTTDFDIDNTKVIWCDKLKIQRIALNIISNAIKYTPDGGSVSVNLKQSNNDGNNIQYVLDVNDTGIGISEEFIKNMFEPFSQEKRSEAITEQGTGLGLSIVKRYLDLIGGSISVSSKLHRGTQIEVVIPVESMQENIERESSITDVNAVLKDKHILLCEDNYMNREIAVMLLKEKGRIVETDENGLDGVDKFEESEEGSFDAVLMDIRMPLMNGYEATRRIRSINRSDARTVPVIAMTADAFFESVKEASEAGMNSYITKPIEPGVLYSTIADSISGGECSVYHKV